MTLQLELWHAISLVIVIIGGYYAVGKIAAGQMYRRLDERFESIKEARVKDSADIQNMFDKHAHEERTRLDRIEADVKSHGERMARVESDIEHAPTHDDIKGIHLRIDLMQKDVGRLPGIEHLLLGINDYLMKNK